jgi:site-specific DNA-cytosine methylase
MRILNLQSFYGNYVQNKTDEYILVHDKKYTKACTTYFPEYKIVANESIYECKSTESNVLILSSANIRNKTLDEIKLVLNTVTPSHDIIVIDHTFYSGRNPVQDDFNNLSTWFVNKEQHYYSRFLVTGEQCGSPHAVRKSLHVYSKREFNLILPNQNLVKLKDIELTSTFTTPYGIIPSDKDIEILKKIEQGQSILSLSTDFQRMYIGNHVYEQRRAKGLARCGYRVDLENVCPSLSANPYNRMYENIHPTLPRPLSVIDYALIQGIPKERILAILDNKNTFNYSALAQVIPYQMATVILNSIKTHLGE